MLFEDFKEKASCIHKNKFDYIESEYNYPDSIGFTCFKHRT